MSDFSRMHPVAAYFRHRFDNCGDFYLRLAQLIAYNKTNIACSDHQYFFTWDNTVNIHQCLHCAGSVYAREVVIGERNQSFLRSGGDNGFFGFYAVIVSSPSIAVKTSCSG